MAQSLRQSRSTVMQTQRTAAITVLSAALLLGTCSPAFAVPPVDLSGVYVLDETGVLDGEIPRIEAALDRLFDAGGAQLFVVVVDRFEGSLDGLAWADETAALSGLGDRDALLAIAVDDREYAASVGTQFVATDEQLATAETDGLVPALRDDRWADGIIGYADSLTAALTPVDGAADAGGGIPIVPIVLGVGLIGGVAAAWFLIARARRTRGPVTAAVEQQSVAELDQTASRRLVQLDDALTTSEQELGFAEAQFGAAPTEGFRTALTQAKGLVADAFRVRRELDDEKPETDEQKRTALEGIAAACDQADDLLEAQEDAFDALRDVEKDLPGAIATLTSARTTAPAALDAADATVTRLRSEFGAVAIASIVDAPPQARRLLELADTELAEATAHQQAGKTGEAAIDVRSAQLALAQLTSATTGVERLAAELAEARTALAAQQGDLRAGIASAGTLPTSPALASALAAAESAVGSTDTSDPIAALGRLVAVDRDLDTQLAGAREEGERRVKAEAALERTLASARSRILSAAEYITAHRGAVGAGARARLAEAQAHEQLASDAKATDPVGALNAAQRALDFAGQALQSAENDVITAMAPEGVIGGLLGGGGFGGGAGRGAGGGISEALIGGLIGGLLGGGGLGGGGGGSSRPRFGSSGGSSSRRSSTGRSSSGRSSGRRGGGGRF